MIHDTPWLEGQGTKIWQTTSNLPAADYPAHLGGWLLWAPWVHPLWQYHFAGLVHLRPINGKPAKITEPGATHEFFVFAVDPHHEPSDLLTENLRFLDPVSIVQQFTVESDAAAVDLIERALAVVADGKASVDSDFRVQWRHFLVEGCDELRRGGTQ